MCLWVSYKEKNMKRILFWHPKSHWRKESDPVLDPDLPIRIRPKFHGSPTLAGGSNFKDIAYTCSMLGTILSPPHCSLHSENNGETNLSSSLFFSVFPAFTQFSINFSSSPNVFRSFPSLLPKIIFCHNMQPNTLTYKTGIQSKNLC